MSRRGRGGGRGGFGRKGPSSGKDLIGETMEDLGLNHDEVDLADADALFPSVEPPIPVRLTDKDAYLVQKQREMMHEMDIIFERDRTLTGMNRTGLKLPQNIEIVVPNEKLADEIYFPTELSYHRTCKTTSEGSTFTSTASILQPKAFESTFKALEVRESKSKVNEADQQMHLSEEELSADEADDYQADYYGSENESDDGNDLGDIF